MPKISLGSYTFRVRRSGQTKGEEEWELLGSIGDNNRDFLEFLRSFWTDRYEDHEEDETRQSLLVADEFSISDQTVWGFVRSGPWGASADIVNHRTRQLEHRMSPEEAPLMPFFFLFHVPPDTERGIMVLQRHGRRGIKTHLGRALERAFRDWQGGYLLRTWQHVPGQVLDLLTNGRMRDIELISYEIPTDLHEFDATLQDETAQWEENRGEIRTRVTAKRGMRWPIPEAFRDVIAGRRTFHEVEEELGVETDRIQITIDYQGTERTIDLTNPQDISPYFDISDHVPLNEGHPDRDQLRDYVLNDVLPDLVEGVQARYP